MPLRFGFLLVDVDSVVFEVTDKEVFVAEILADAVLDSEAVGVTDAVELSVIE